MTSRNLRDRLGSALLFLCPLLLTACSSTPVVVPSPVDEEFNRLESAARNAHSRGELSYAADLYADLLTEAERTDDPSKIGDSCYNLAVCRVALGDWNAARDLLLVAEHELDRAREPLAQVFIARARLELLAGNPAASRAAAEDALEDSRSKMSAREAAEAHVLIGLAALNSKDTTLAESSLESAKAASKEGASLPSILRLGARIALAKGEWSAAGARFDLEAETNQKLSRYDAMALALELAGDAWQKSGDMPRARDRWLRAARGRFAQALRRDSPPPRALASLKLAAELCARLDDEAALAADPNLRARVRNLIERMEAERVRLASYVLDAQRADGVANPAQAETE